MFSQVSDPLSWPGGGYPSPAHPSPHARTGGGGGVPSPARKGGNPRHDSEYLLRRERYAPCGFPQEDFVALIATAFSQLMGCMRFGFIVTIAPCEHLLSIPCNPFAATNKSQSHPENSPYAE